MGMTHRRNGIMGATQVGVAIGPSGLTAVTLRRSPRGLRPGQVMEYALDPHPAEGEWTELARVLAELKRSLGGRPITLSIALLPPLASAKVVALPPVRPSQLRPLLQRSIRRYFATCSDAALADARRLNLPPRPSGAQTLAVCAAERTVAAVMAAAHAAGARVSAVTAAPIALLEAVPLLARRSRGTLAVITAAAAWSELLLLDDGVPRRLQPVPRAARLDDSARVQRLREALSGIGQADGDRGPASVLVCGSDPAAQTLRSCLRGGSQRVEPGAGEPMEPGSGALETYPGGLRHVAAPATEAMPAAGVAAFGAALLGERPPQLVTDQLRARRRVRHRRWTAGLGVAAALVTAVAGGVHLHGLHREVAAVEAARRAAAPAVEDATQTRRALAELRDRLESVARLHEDAGPGWTGFFGELAGTLPDSAYIVSFTGRPEEIRFSGFAHEAHGVVPALHASPLFGDATFAAPLRREGTDGRERFELTVSVRGRPDQPEEEGS
jgi:hypothetical protein